MPETTSKKTKKLYALLVGIDKYKSIRGLSGCVNDVFAIRKYLKEAANQDGFELSIKALTDDAAVKDNIVNAFTEQMIDKPGPDDIAFFYYAGHGGQEQADEVFHISDTSKKNEVLICYDSTLEKSGMDLADKEMRYLIHKASLKGSHLVTIFDCCHSGGNTRSAAAPKILTRQLAAGKPLRDYDDFIFAKEIPKSTFASGKSLNEIIPQGNHIQIAACRDREEANEYPGDEPRGAFSYSLINVLKKAQGGITYYDLYSRLKMSMENLVHKMQVIDPRVVSQTPQIYVRSDDSSAVFKPFLDGAVNQQRRYCNLIFDARKETWKIDMGAIHGVKSPNDGVTRIYVFEEGASLDGEHTHTAVVAEVTPSEATISFEGETPTGEFLTGYVKGLLTRPVHVFLDGEAAGTKVIKEQFEEEETAKSLKNKVKLVDAKEDADYLMVAKDKEYLITQKDSSNPLVEQIAGYTPSAGSIAAVYLKHMSNWEFVKALANTDNDSNFGGKPPVKMEILRTQPDGTGGEVIPIDNGVISWDFDKNAEGKHILMFKLRLTNTSDQKLYCSVAYLSQTFQVYPDILAGGMVELDHGENNTEWALGGQPIPFQVSPYIEHYNWEHATDYFKLVISTQPFRLDSMAMPALPEPKVPNRKASGTRSSFMFSPPKPKEKHEWTTALVEIRSKNPFFKA